MPMLKHVLVFVAVLCLMSCAKARKAVDEGDLWWKHIEYLASDDLQGRYTGSDGYRKAANYVAQEFQSLGLQPRGTEGYLQRAEFDTRRLIPGKSSVEVVIDGKIQELEVPEEAIPFPSGNSGDVVEAPLLFAGYGLVVPESGYDDFAGLPTAGAVAIAFAGAPKSVASLVAAHYSSPEMATRNGVQKGLRGSLLVANPRVFDLPWDRLINSVLQTAMEPRLPGMREVWKAGPFALVKPEALDRILAGSGHTLREISDLDAGGKPLPHFALKARIRMKPVFVSDEVTAPNVVAMFPGSDPALKDEFVLLSAHLDHIGVGEPVNGDRIYNGAMDNASGVATLLEVARLLKVSGKQFKRSILFLTCTGEEEGEKGSLYFAEKPTVDLKNVIADINLDMYLPLFPLKELRAYGLGESDLAGYLQTAAGENGIRVQDDPTPERNIFIRSDQYSFIKKGVPALFLSFGYDSGSHEETLVNAWFEHRYHGPSDDLNQPVDKKAAAKFNQLMATLSERIANTQQRPRWKQDSFFRRFVQSRGL